MPIFNENVYDLLILFKAVESTPPADFPAEGNTTPGIPLLCGGVGV